MQLRGVVGFSCPPRHQPDSQTSLPGQVGPCSSILFAFSCIPIGSLNPGTSGPSPDTFARPLSTMRFVGSSQPSLRIPLHPLNHPIGETARDPLLPRSLGLPSRSCESSKLVNNRQLVPFCWRLRARDDKTSPQTISPNPTHNIAQDAVPLSIVAAVGSRALHFSSSTQHPAASPRPGVLP